MVNHETNDMTWEILLLFALLVLATAFFATERFSIDVVALAVVCALVLSGILTPTEAFAGFANDVMIILASVFILSGALVKAGVMAWLGALLSRLSGDKAGRSRLLLLSVGAAASAFFSNTSATAVLMPAALETARRAQQSASRYLMPLAYASILGGTCTLIGTSTNLAGSGMAAQLGLEPFSLFEFFGVGIIVAAVGIIWLSVFGDRFIPIRTAPELTERYGVREFLSTLIVAEDSAASENPLGEAGLEGLGVAPLAILRDKVRLPANPLRNIRSGDRLLVKASPEALKKVSTDGKFAIEADAQLTDKDISRDALAMGEAVLMPQSRLVGKTVKSTEFFRFKDLVVLAIYRRGQAYPVEIENMLLRVGDVLLIQGERSALMRLRGDPDLWGLAEVDETVLSPRQGVFVLAALTTALIVGALGLAPLSIALLVAVLIVVGRGAITMEEAYGFIEWRLLVLIAGMTSLGGAMVKTGAAELAAAAIVSVCLPFGPTVSLAAFAMLTVLLTQPMSNAAAALTVMPVAVAAADLLNVEPRALAILVTLSASLSFVTPLEPASLLIYGPGKYKFIDFFRAGLPLTLISLALVIFLVPIIWPLSPN